MALSTWLSCLYRKSVSNVACSFTGCPEDRPSRKNNSGQTAVNLPEENLYIRNSYCNFSSGNRALVHTPRCRNCGADFNLLIKRFVGLRQLAKLSLRNARELRKSSKLISSSPAQPHTADQRRRYTNKRSKTTARKLKYLATDLELKKVSGKVERKIRRVINMTAGFFTFYSQSLMNVRFTKEDSKLCDLFLRHLKGVQDFVHRQDLVLCLRKESFSSEDELRYKISQPSSDLVYLTRAFVRVCKALNKLFKMIRRRILKIVKS